MKSAELDQYGKYALATHIQDPDSPPLYLTLKGPDTDKWESAVQKEINQLPQLRTWDLIPRPAKVNLG
ncbi:hypothetical protein SERLA73DRAFT_70156 [Serpula lacrymans var. lacrymans S7.3]|uniref:Uncharacterized protein n=2 Tax=Serpula lacrymans var. lacrymans TaxID=341189 RepID=F8PM35_SERL3|nr:uncharacterized protein SERLADRAFT_434279 [Serpula lacrymans var. lacrymans S7.9]EGO02667.1 hypothetical protein SERLA73DRAFT_70156 [Serpula lacrymans var. lacrymans S7.3]EGO28373.1 hypothetical protein SERLADRAFT_434279 [Serpula lacrymans var. lacrymans S7.9]